MCHAAELEVCSPAEGQGRSLSSLQSDNLVEGRGPSARVGPGACGPFPAEVNTATPCGAVLASGTRPLASRRSRGVLYPGFADG